MSKDDLQRRDLALAEAAHELRAPLGGIESMIQLLAGTGLSAEQLRLVTALEAAAAHLRLVASDIIDTSRGKGRSLPGVASESFSLAALLDGVRASAEARTQTKGLAFRFEVTPDVPDAVVGDRRSIRQMLENLLDNAVKVTASGSISLNVGLVDQRGAFVGLLFSVRDTGPGIADADKDRLFKAFSRLDNGVEGSGLGLSMVARMARAMGGDAGCASEIGDGATFWFSLRLKTMLEEPLPVAAPDGTDCEPQSRNVLVVDDNQANRMIMGAILEHFGYRAIEAESAETALELIATMPLAAVMMDQTLPGMSGLDALRAIRAMEGPLASIPVIPVTGRVAAADREAFARAGADGFVEKPVNARTIRDAIAAALTTRSRMSPAA